MPKLLNVSSGMQSRAIPGLAGFEFSAVRTDRLGASEYTLVTLVVDTSTSVQTFRDLLVSAIKLVVDGCKKSPRANNLLVRVVTFADNVTELHGFKPLSEIDPADYDSIHPSGNTALYDATASGLGAMAEFARMLAKQDYTVNGRIYIITDGANNRSKYTAATVKEKLEGIVRDEIMGDCLSILVGINAAHYQQVHEEFVTNAGLSAYVKVENATASSMAKLGNFISRSASQGSSGTGPQGQGQAGASITI